MRLTAISALLSGLAVVLPIVAILAPVQISATFIVFGFFTVLISRRRLNRRVLFWGASGVALVTIWGALSSLWSVTPSASLERLLTMAPLLGLGAAILAAAAQVDVVTRRMVERALQTGVILALTILALILTASTLQGAVFADASGPPPSALFKVGGTGLGAVTLIAAASLLRLRKRETAFVAIVLTAIMIQTTNSTTAMIAYLAGLVALLAAYFAPRAAGYAAALALPLFILMTPWVPTPPFSVLEVVNDSGLHRIAIWHFVSEHIQAAPLLGWGLDAARAFPGGDALLPVDYLGAEVQALPAWTALIDRGTAELIPLHPHNNAMQIWLELGALGAMAYAAVFFAAALAITRMPRADASQKAGLLALLTFQFVVAQSSFGIWQSWWLSLQFTMWTLALVILTRRVPQRESGRSSARRRDGATMGPSQCAE